MTNRITGTNSGIDVDMVVKESLLKEQNKIDKAYQQQMVYTYQQEQLRDIVKSATSFYDKYLDILNSDSLLRSNAYETVTFTSLDSKDTSVTAKGYAGADITDYTVQITNTAKKASTTIKADDLTGMKDGKLTFTMGKDSEGKDITAEVDITFKNGVMDLDATAKALNAELKKQGIDATAKFSQFSGGIVIESGAMGEDVSFNVQVTGTKLEPSDGEATIKESFVKNYNATGENAAGIITKKDGTVYKIPDGTKTNTITVDNIQFTFNNTNAVKESDGKITGGTTLTGKTDISGLKDKIINFVNDYNKLMESINEKLWEKRDKDYMPLTDEQKKEMSESEIEAWEKKAKTGLLRNDSDLTRIQSAMKSAMSSMMSSTGLTLESIGIKPVDNYTTKNGMFTIDEDKLTAALETKPEEVKDLFTRSSSDKEKGGVLTQLQIVFKNEIKSSSSSLSKKIGFEGTSTESNNTLSKNIINQKKLITELKEKFKSKETALYNKYSNLEVMLEKLNSQYNSLVSLLGQ